RLANRRRWRGQEPGPGAAATGGRADAFGAIELGEGACRPCRERARRPARPRPGGRHQAPGTTHRMRQGVLDTETTGLSWEKGNRVVEIACVELVDRSPTGRSFQRYIDPQRDMEPGAEQVTGLSREFLAGKPLFADIVEEFLDFV